MKYLKSYIILVILTFSVAFSANATRAAGALSVEWFDTNSRSSQHTTATPNGHGRYTVTLPKAGTYTISYASGPKKGQVIETVTATKAGPVTMRLAYDTGYVYERKPRPTPTPAPKKQDAR